MINRLLPVEEEVLIEVVAAHVVPDLDREMQGDTLLRQNLTEGEVGGRTDTVVQVIVDLGVGHRGEGRTFGQTRITVDPGVERNVHTVHRSLDTVPVGGEGTGFVTLVEQDLSLDEASLGIGTHIGRRGNAAVERTGFTALVAGGLAGTAVEEIRSCSIALRLGGAFHIIDIVGAGRVVGSDIPAVGRIPVGAQRAAGEDRAVVRGHIHATGTTPVADPLDIGRGVVLIAGVVSPGDDLVGTRVFHAVAAEVREVLHEGLGHHIAGVHTADGVDRGVVHRLVPTEDVVRGAVVVGVVDPHIVGNALRAVVEGCQDRGGVIFAFEVAAGLLLVQLGAVAGLQQVAEHRS